MHHRLLILSVVGSFLDILACDTPVEVQTRDQFVQQTARAACDVTLEIVVENDCFPGKTLCFTNVPSEWTYSDCIERVQRTIHQSLMEREISDDNWSMYQRSGQDCLNQVESVGCGDFSNALDESNEEDDQGGCAYLDFDAGVEYEIYQACRPILDIPLRFY